jgi:hypothetical protein
MLRNCVTEKTAFEIDSGQLLRLTADTIRSFRLAFFVVRLSILDKPVTVLGSCKMPKTAFKDA